LSASSYEIVIYVAEMNLEFEEVLIPCGQCQKGSKVRDR